MSVLIQYWQTLRVQALLLKTRTIQPRSGMKKQFKKVVVEVAPQLFQEKEKILFLERKLKNLNLECVISVGEMTDKTRPPANQKKW